MYISDRFSPNARTLTSVHPGRGSGTGTSRTRSTSGGPGRSATTARIIVDSTKERTTRPAEIIPVAAHEPDPPGN
ncbi:hypothetical protein GCM10009727_32390 [Actinomadura napierensis]|uniref:Uncharacterized protein n=1 Tax=Actinomadura napierensis TaxID=267854 RepID=A0ABN2Z5U1_9ACTN